MKPSPSSNKPWPWPGSKVTPRSQSPSAPGLSLINRLCSNRKHRDGANRPPMTNRECGTNRWLFFLAGINPNSEIGMVAHAARVPVWAARPNLRSHSLSNFGARKFVGRDFRRAAENRTPAACAPQAAAPHSTSTSEFGINLPQIFRVGIFLKKPRKIYSCCTLKAAKRHRRREAAEFKRF